MFFPCVITGVWSGAILQHLRDMIARPARLAAAEDILSISNWQWRALPIIEKSDALPEDLPLCQISVVERWRLC